MMQKKFILKQSQENNWVGSCSKEIILLCSKAFPTSSGQAWERLRRAAAAGAARAAQGAAGIRRAAGWDGVGDPDCRRPEPRFSLRGGSVLRAILHECTSP